MTIGVCVELVFSLEGVVTSQPFAVKGFVITVNINSMGFQFTVCHKTGETVDAFEWLSKNQIIDKIRKTFEIKSKTFSPKCLRLC